MAVTLSRSPLEEEPDTVEDVQVFVDLVEYTWPATDNQLEAEAGAKDAQLQKVVAVTSQGWPTRVEEVTLQTREFFEVRGYFSISSGL